MNKLIDTFQHFLNKKGIIGFNNFFHKVVDRDLFILFYFLVCLINWTFHLRYFAIIIGLLLILLLILFNINRFRIIPIVLFFIASLRLESPEDYLWPALIATIIIFPVLIIDLLKKPLKLNNPILIGMFFILIAMFFSIINSPNFIMPILGILMMIAYIFIFIYFYNKKRDYDQNDLWLYIAKSFTYFGMLILFETIIYNFEMATSSNFLSFFNWKAVDLSWANTNYIAMIYLIIIPLTAFWYSRTQKHFYLIIVMLLEILALVLTISRGAYLAMLVSWLPFFIIFISDIKNKIAFTQKSLIMINLFLIILLIVAIPTGLVKSFFEVLNSRGLSLVGRELLYKVGLNVFLRYPLFGGGIYTSEYYLSLVGTSVYYHNFIIHTLASIGILGMIAFIYYLYQMFRQSLWKCSYNTYIFFIILGISVHGLFDTTFYNPLIMVILSIILPLMLEKKVIDEQNRKELTNVYN
ncbi:MAG: O-antigen ligase family protein [Bacilli bacterium]